jgi:hypothetical protein
MIQNLQEQFLYDRLPAGLLELDERGLIQAVVGGYQDRIDDLRSYSRKLELLFQTDALPETGDNVVFVDIESDQGKVYTRSLDLQDDTPDDGTAALTTWTLDQLGDAVNPDKVSNIRYGRDLLRLVDTDTLGYLATTIGAILYQSSALSPAAQTTANQQIVQTYFPRLKIKGTAASFDTLGRLLGFDDVKLTPLWARVSPRVPNDIGSPDNNPDFSAESEYQPQQQIDDFYNPLKTNDGPFFTWFGTVKPGTASTEFCTQVVNGFNPWVEVTVLHVQGGTVTYPAAGSYALGSSGSDSVGGPHKKAYVQPDDSDILFEAIGEGQYFNGIEIHVVDSGTNKIFSISDRLSALKYRSSYFDLALTAEFDRVEELFGSSSMKRNKDLAANPTLTSDGTAVSPYRPWTSGSISTGSVVADFLVMSGTVNPQVIHARTQSTGTDRQLNVDELVAAGVQVAQALEEVRAATRLPRRLGAGFLIRDSVGYAAYEKETLLFSTSGGGSYSGSNTHHPLSPFYTDIAVQVGTNRIYAEAVVDPANSNGFLFASPGFTGTYDFTSGSYTFVFPSAIAGTEIYALWHPASTEVVRTEPATGTNKGYQGRPEDQENGNIDEVADDFPWRRDLTAGGELVDQTLYNPLVADLSKAVVDPIMAVPGHDGADYSVFGINSTSGILRLLTAVRPTDENYVHGLPGVAYRGTLKNLASVTDGSNITDLERLFEPGAKLYTVGNVQGVLVADPNKFFSQAHRNNLIGWFPFNEHVDSDLPVVDHSVVASDLSPIGLLPEARKYDGNRGWYLQQTGGSTLMSSAVRLSGTDFTISFWFKRTAESFSNPNLFSYGPLRIAWNGTQLEFYNNDNLEGLVAISGLDFNFITYAQSANTITLGSGDLTTPLAVSSANGTFAGFTGSEAGLSLTGAECGLSDMRLWSAAKSTTDLESIRDYQPKETVTAYQVGSFLSLNRRDRYALKVLPNGQVAAGALPGWYRVPRLAFVQRYDSLGQYTGESRFDEVGYGGGPVPPASFKLGQQFYNLTAAGETVVAPATGFAPGINSRWRNEFQAPLYLKVIQTGSTSFDTFVSSGTSNPWPNKMAQTNTGQQSVYVKSDDGYVYEVSLESSGSNSASLVAELIARQRSSAELELAGYGTNYSGSVVYSEQPTGAETVMTGNGRQMVVSVGGTAVYQAPYSGTVTTPPIFLYLNSRTVEDVDDAYDRWTDPSDFGNEQVPPTAALQENGVLEFTNTGAIVPGDYRLTVYSGNIGKVDSDFDGFAVEITVDATILEKRLCQGLTGYNFTGTDVFEFGIDNAVSGEWLLSFKWTNSFSDPNRGEARQLAITKYKLERLTTELYRIATQPSGSHLSITQLDTGTYDGSVPGGWLAGYNSYGTVVQFTHESQIYSSNDTLTSRTPHSGVFTATTMERREDILGPTNIVLIDAVAGTLPSFGTITVS